MAKSNVVSAYHFTVRRHLRDFDQTMIRLEQQGICWKSEEGMKQVSQALGFIPVGPQEVLVWISIQSKLVQPQVYH